MIWNIKITKIYYVGGTTYDCTYMASLFIDICKTMMFIKYKELIMVKIIQFNLNLSKTKKLMWKLWLIDFQKLMFLTLGLPGILFTISKVTLLLLLLLYCVYYLHFSILTWSYYYYYHHCDYSVLKRIRHTKSLAAHRILLHFRYSFCKLI